MRNEMGETILYPNSIFEIIRNCKHKCLQISVTKNEMDKIIFHLGSIFEIFKYWLWKNG